MSNWSSKAAIGGIIFLLLIISFGCANNISHLQSQPSEEDILRDRVHKYWQYKIDLDLDKAYEMEDPAYRSVENKVRYFRHHNIDMVKWEKAEIAGMKIATENAVVNMNLMIKLLLPGKRSPEAIPTTIEDKWVKVDGAWFHLFRAGALTGEK